MPGEGEDDIVGPFRRTADASMALRIMAENADFTYRERVKARAFLMTMRNHAIAGIMALDERPKSVRPRVLPEGIIDFAEAARGRRS